MTKMMVVMRRMKPATEETVMIIRKLFWSETTVDDSLTLVVVLGTRTVPVDTKAGEHIQQRSYSQSKVKFLLKLGVCICVYVPVCMCICVIK